MKLIGKALLILVVLLLLLAAVFHERVADLYAQATPINYQLDASGILPPSEQLADAANWKSLFNGESLDGWSIKFTGSKVGENVNNTFRAENGVLSVNYSDWDSFEGRFGHIYTEQSYSHYIFQFEYRFVGDQVKGAGSGMSWAIRNNGAMLHAQHPNTMRLEQEFPVSIEAQLLGGLEDGERPTANLCTPATNVVLNGEVYRAHCTESVSKTYHGDQWVKAEFEVLGSQRIRHFINGELVFEYEQPQYDPFSVDANHIGKATQLIDRGHIAFQAESHPTQFRNIRLLELPAS
ncbi:MAG: DUF1080 domain-containing protein [Pseudomonadales bacterium]